jgi:hypothetical protein
MTAKHSNYNEIADLYTREGCDAATIAFLYDLPVAEVMEVLDQIDHDELEAMQEFDDRMDGDFDSAMASAGWGTDEDYNHYEYDSGDY